MLTLAFAASFLAVVPAGDVLVVDPLGTGTFLTIQAAVDAATDGDVVLVRGRPSPGAPVVIDGKDISLIGLGARPVDLGRLDIRNLPNGSCVFLENLRVTSNSEVAIALTDCEGSVWARHVTAIAGYTARLRAERCDAVVLDRCNIGFGYTVGRFDGVRLSESSLAAYDTTGLGGLSYATGTGIPWTCTGVIPGGHGLTGVHSEVRLEGGLFQGSDPVDCFGFGGGETASIAAGTGMRVRMVETELRLGVPPFTGDVAELTVARARLDVQPVAVVNGSIELRLRGTPGALATLVIAEDTGFRPLGDVAGVLVVGPTWAGSRIPLGVVPASGELWTTIPAPMASASAGEVRRYALQCALLDPNTHALTLSSPAALHVLAEPSWWTDERIYVRSDAAPGGDGRSWATAFSTLQSARDAIVAPPPQGEPGAARREVWIAAGDYTLPPPIYFEYGSASFPLYDWLSLRGGFAGHESTASARDSLGPPTRLTSPAWESYSSVFLLEAGFEPDDGVAELDSLTVTGVTAHEIVDSSGRLVIERCHFLDCTANALVALGPLRMSDCTIQRMLYTYLIGTVYPFSTQVEPCLIEDTLILGCQPRNVLPSTLFGLAHSTSVRNCTILDNGNPARPTRAIVVGGNASQRIRIESTILYGHRSSLGQDLASQVSITAGADYQFVSSLVQGWTGTLQGIGTFSADPGFNDRIGPDQIRGSGDEDLRLAPGSPCVDAGATELVRTSNTVDQAGLPRIVDDPAVLDTGTGGPPVVDIGALERQP